MKFDTLYARTSTGAVQEWSPYNIPLIPYCDPMFRDYE
jgi:hypothetical protein